MESEDDLPFQFLREITNGFSEESKLGQGAFGIVYKGVTKNGDDVAVKMLSSTNLDHKQFQNEFYNLKMLKHQNIVQVLGYCYETEQKPFIMPNGSMVFADETHRALCFEYLHNGNLQKYLSDEFCGLDWHMRFKIIKGTCEGIKYIHEELEELIYHLDLKPDNILLDKDMVPKIADFGSSRIFGKELARNTQKPYGTPGYQPPEYIDRGEISGKFDIFSLGVVMIRIALGPKGYPKCLDMSSDEFIDQVKLNWRKRLQATCSSDSLLEAYCHQVGTCTLIALNCLKEDSQKRPNIGRIIEKLNEIETSIGKNGCCKTVSGTRSHKKKIEMRNNITLMTGPNNCSDLEFVDAKETSSDIVEEHIVGRTEEKGKIMTSLLEGVEKKIVILPIYGIGGIGKTTLARLIYNDPKFKCHSQVWVHVSQRFDLNKIRESTISQLSRKESQANERQMTRSCLMELLSGKMILIVLDDLWEDNQFQLQELKDMLYHDDSNIIILVTTRSQCVAERICTNIQPYKILPLTIDMCWDIIKQRSGFEGRDDKEQLMSVGLEIAQKCGGVALAAKSLGFTLRSMNSDQWMNVKDNDIWNEPVSSDVSVPNHVLASLKLSYSYMALYLKPCFTYCAIFPKGHKIVKNDLIYQWISLDLIKPTKLLSNIQLCEKYIVQLLGLSFFQFSVSPKTVGWHHEKDGTVFTMHDLVHDLAELVMGDEILYAREHGNTGGSRIYFELLNDCIESLKAFTQYPIKIRALRFLETDKAVLNDASASASSSSAKFLSFRVSGHIGLHDDDIFLDAKYIRVLDLSQCSIPKLPNSIGNLKHLRYLNAPSVDHWMIPSCLTKLSKLSYFSLRNSSIITELPESIGEMEGLTYLDLSGCSIRELPVSFGGLKNLVHLNLSWCGAKGLSESLESLTNLEYLNLAHCWNIGKLPEHLGSLVKLQNLDLSDSSYIKGSPNAEVLANLTKLESLNLSSYRSRIKNLPEALSRLTNLRYLNLSGVDYIDPFRSERPMTLGNGPMTLRNLTQLRYLNLSDSKMHGWAQASFFISLECIGSLPNLEHLDLSNNHSLTSVPDCVGRLRKLHALDLSGCKNLQSLPAILGEMDSLKFLDLNECPKLEMSEMPRLNKSLLTLPHFVVQADSHDSCSNLVLLQDANCNSSLVISKLENVKSMQEARNIKLVEKEIIRTLELNWTEHAERFVEDIKVLGELVPPIYLGHLKIDGYNSVRFPDWFGGISFHLPYLEIVELYNLPKCKTLAPFGRLPNLRELTIRRMNGISKIDWDWCGTKRQFPKLEVFYLHEMESLQVWDTTCTFDRDDVPEFMFPELFRLTIDNCPNLRLTSCPLIAEWWGIMGNCDRVISSWGEGISPPSTLQLHIVGCKVPMHQWRLLHHLPDLGYLSIEECSDLSSSAEIIRVLSSLHCLDLKHNHQTELPNWLGQLASLEILTMCSYKVKALPDAIGHLTRLHSLCLEDFASMTTLPQSVGNLLSLQKLEISRCPNLNDLPESIGHLTSLHTLEISQCGITSLPKSIGGLTSLNKLNLSFCHSMTSLPESIQQLTNLEYLTISGCYELVRWCRTENKRKLAHITAKRLNGLQFS